MKTNPLLTLLAATGATFTLAVPTVFPQEAIRSDASGTLLTPLSLGSSQLTGRLSPGHLGTGTPTSTTVLRGDGAWVGTTPTGATIASRSALLMGDNAGDAAAVSDTAMLGRMTRARLEAQVAAETLPLNLLTASNLTSGTINADGTLTVAANGSVSWAITVNASDVPNTPLYGYVVATTDAPYGALRLRANYAVDHDSDAVDSTLAPGAYRTQFVNLTGVAGYNVVLRNSTASPITVFFPVVATQDTGLAPLASHADLTAVAAPPVLDLDFTRFDGADRSARYQLEKLSSLAADSVHGGAGNAGTLYAPKLTLQQTIGNGGVFGLYRGSTFRESLPLPASTTHGIVVQDVALGSVKPLPVVSALDPVFNSSLGSPAAGAFSYLWTPTESAIVNDGYSNVYLVEIDTALESATPVAARRRLTDVTSQAAVVSTPGSVYVQPPGVGAGQSGSSTQWLATFHPSDGVQPGSGHYRYEVVSRVCPANWGSFDSNAGDGAMSGLVLVGGSSGYGSLSGPRGFVGDRLAFLHAATHGAVIGGGSLQRSVFYEAGDDDSIQLAWYAGTGTGLRFDTARCLFFANVGDRPANGIIAHTGGSTTFDQGDISDCAFLGARWSDGSLKGTAIDYVNVAAGTIDRVFVQGVAYPFGTQMSTALETRRSVFRGVYSTNATGNFHDNLVVAEPLKLGNDPTYSVARGWTFVTNGSTVSNNLFWARGIATAVTGQQVMGFQNGANNCTARRNIIVLDPATPQTQATYYQNYGTGLSLDYNLVVSTSAVLGAPNQSNNVPTWAAYQAGNTSLDVHSLYVDLSADPRGLKAVFVDPANGDFRWAQTDVARRCAAYCRANHVGPATVTSRWPLVPTVDEAVRLLTDL